MSTDSVNPMADIMSADEKVDALPDIGVMDCYVRSKLMKALMKTFSSGPGAWENPDFKDGENALMHGSPEMVRLWAIKGSRKGIVSRWVSDAAHDNRSEDFVIAVFDGITNDDWDREKCIDVARDALKRHLSGSIGMPDDRVIRECMKSYDGSDA